MVVGGQHQALAVPERIRLADQTAGAGGIRREDDGVVVRRGVEMPEDGPRACSTSRVEALEVGFSECGFPKQPALIRVVCATSCDRAASPAPV
jgi:hypothetical protein